MLQRRLAASLRLACALMDFSRNTIPTISKLEPAKALNRSQPTTTDYLIVENHSLGVNPEPFRVQGPFGLKGLHLVFQSLRKRHTPNRMPNPTRTEQLRLTTLFRDELPISHQVVEPQQRGL